MSTPKKAVQPVRRQLKSGEILFEEGDGSSSMYVVKSGMLRIFKKKGKSDIEIDTIRTGQIVGELAFLDGNPRSASAETLTDTTLMEISSDAFSSAIEKMPEWLRLLLKTVVGRLRSASTRIRQLEQASTSFSYSNIKGSREQSYIYLSVHDTLKVFACLLLVASRSEEKDAKGISVRVSVLQKYANQIMGIPIAKVTSILDVLAKAGVVRIDDESGGGLKLLDADFLETCIDFINEENQKEPSKQKNLSKKGFRIMGIIVQNLKRYTDEQGEDLVSINIAEIITLETGKTGKKPFSLEDFYELCDMGYAGQMNMESSESALTSIKVEVFKKLYRIQRVVKGLEEANDNKKNHGHGVAA